MEYFAFIGMSVFATLLLSLIEKELTGRDFSKTVADSDEPHINLGARLMWSIFLPGFTQIIMLGHYISSSQKK